VNLITCSTLLGDTPLPFEKGCFNQWFDRESGNTNALTDSLTSWLFDEKSLTKRLQAHSNHFEVKVLREGSAQVSPHERQLFSNDLFTENAAINSREVLLICDGQPQVYARTLIPPATLAHAENLLTTLGNASLGSVLFHADNMQRQAIETTSFAADSSMMAFANQLHLTCQSPLWARRSIFTLDGYPLMVSEVFLPNSYAYDEVITHE